MHHQKQKLHKFKSLYVENVAVLARFATRYVSPNVAEDIIHEVYLELWKDDRIVDRELKFSYLLTAVRNKCINYTKQKELRRKHIEKLTLEIREGDDEKSQAEEEQLHQIYAQVELLPDKCRMIFKMAYLEGKKSGEIAEMLNLSIRTVEHQLYLGLKTIRNQLKFSSQE